MPSDLRRLRQQQFPNDLSRLFAVSHIREHYFVAVRWGNGNARYSKHRPKKVLVVSDIAHIAQRDSTNPAMDDPVFLFDMVIRQTVHSLHKALVQHKEKTKNC